MVCIFAAFMLHTAIPSTLNLQDIPFAALVLVAVLVWLRAVVKSFTLGRQRDEWVQAFREVRQELLEPSGEGQLP